MRQKTNYLNNAQMLEEIHKSKTSYCEYIDTAKYKDYDLIVDTVKQINRNTIKQARENKLARMIKKFTKEQKELGKKTKEINEMIDKLGLEKTKYNKEDLVFRVMVDDHIPRFEKNGKIKRVPINFHPFQHWAYIDDELVCVGKSHFKNGVFDPTKGKITNLLALMYMKLVERYSLKGNWRGYSFRDEMCSQAIIQLTVKGLLFNEAKSDNPFAYYTTIVTNSFRGVLNIEKTERNIRDELMVASGYNSSFGKQAEQEINNNGE